MGTPTQVANALRREAFRPGAACQVSAGAKPTADSALVENIVLRPRRGERPAAAVAQLRWTPSGLTDVRVALGAPAVWRDP